MRFFRFAFLLLFVFSVFPAAAQEPLTLSPFATAPFRFTAHVVTAHPTEERLVVISDPDAGTQTQVIWDIATGSAEETVYPLALDNALDGFVYLRDGESEDAVLRWRFMPPEMTGGYVFDAVIPPLHDLVALPEGNGFLTASEDGIQRVTLGGEITVIVARAEFDLSPHRIYIAPDGESVFAALYNFNQPTLMRRYALADGEILAEFALDGTLKQGMLSPDGKSFAAAVYNGISQTSVYDVADGRLLFTIGSEDVDCVTSAVAYTPDGALLALTTGGSLHIYDAARYELLAQAEIPCAAVRALIFTASGDALALFQEGETATVYRVAGE